MFELDVWARPERDGVVVRVVGDLDMATSLNLREVMDRAVESSAVVVELDLHEVDFIDSLGLATLLQGSTKARIFGARLLLRAPSSSVIDVLRLTGTYDLVEIVP